MTASKVTQKLYSQKCPACGGDLAFNPQKQMPECVQCGHLVAVDHVKTSEKSFETLLSNAPQWKNDTLVYQCEHCGSKAVIARTDLAKRCEYCGATNIVPAEDLPGIRPDTVVTFKITKDEALARARRWLSKRFYAPKWYKKTINPQNMSGIYYPAFTFDAQTVSSYRGDWVERHTESHQTSNGQVVSQVHYVRNYHTGTFDKNFDEILIPAASGIPDYRLSSLQPFATNDANCYQKEYMFGYTALHYNKNANQCWHEAKKQMDSKIWSEIVSLHFGSAENLKIDTTVKNVTYKYVLLPIYRGHTEYEGKTYELYVNGQTGKVVGKTPIAKWKVWLTVLGALGVGALIALAFLI